jgi:hypothetical protein
MRQLTQNIGDFRRDGGATDPGQNGRIGGADDQIGTNAGRRPAGTLDLANHNADDGEDHRDLDRDGQNTDG